MTYLDFPNVIRPNGSNSDNKESFRGFVILRKMYSPFYSRCFFNYCEWKKAFGSSVRNVMNAEVGTPPTVATPKWLHSPALFLEGLVGTLQRHLPIFTTVRETGGHRGGNWPQLVTNSQKK